VWPTHEHEHIHKSTNIQSHMIMQKHTAPKQTQTCEHKNTNPQNTTPHTHKLTTPQTHRPPKSIRWCPKEQFWRRLATQRHRFAPEAPIYQHQTIFYFIFMKNVHRMISYSYLIKIVNRTILGGSEDGQKTFAVLVLFAVTLGHEFSLTIHE
jgi:hypothetical protein